MRDIDFIRKVVNELAPNFPLIERRFNVENERYKKMLARNHDSIGRILKCHLILENYINRHLEMISPKHNWGKAHLRFAQKMDLLPNEDLKIGWILPGIREINRARNRFGHNIEATLCLDDLKECISVLGIARKNNVYKDAVKVVEDFTTVACTWLIVDPEIQKIIEDAFQLARKR